MAGIEIATGELVGNFQSVSKWTKETPKEQGFYWCRDPQVKIPFVIEISIIEEVIEGYEWCKIEPPK